MSSQGVLRIVKTPGTQAIVQLSFNKRDTFFDVFVYKIHSGSGESIAGQLISIALSVV